MASCLLSSAVGGFCDPTASPWFACDCRFALVSADEIRIVCHHETAAKRALAISKDSLKLPRNGRRHPLGAFVSEANCPGNYPDY